MLLARLIADIEPQMRSDVIFLFSARFDCPHDEETMKYVRQKFEHVFKFTSRSQATGWPAGCNALWSESYQHCIENMRNGRWKGMEAILFMEADCCPLDLNWINHLKHEYKNCGKMVLGCWLDESDCGVTHINGNCIIHKDLWRKDKGILSPGPGAWDGERPGTYLTNGAPSRLIFSDYHHGTDRNPWRSCDHLFSTRRYPGAGNPLYGQDVNPVWLHGVKGPAALECARKRLLS